MTELRALIYDVEGTLVAVHGHPAQPPPATNPPPLPIPRGNRRADRNLRIVLGALNCAAVVAVVLQLNLPT